MQRIIYSTAPHEAIAALIAELAPDRTFVLCDRTTAALCLPQLHIAQLLEQGLAISTMSIEPGDDHKTLDSLSHIWTILQQAGATRHSLMINLGGGMVTDLGGFAAATFKRGMRFVNVPTTLLGMVDAAVGGKTGINFGGLKNEIGAFREAEAVVVSTSFLRTLDQENLRSGYAEMLKHSLLSTPAMWAAHLQFPLAEPDLVQLQEIVKQSIEVKQAIVEEDPHEKGLRKALNLGHTMGHAIESLYLTRQQPLLHGYAVAWGLVAELYMAAAEANFPTDIMRQTARFVFDHYGHPAIGCHDYDKIHDLMRHDKKNRGSEINFTLLGAIGDVRLDQHIDRALIDEALDFLRDA